MRLLTSDKLPALPGRYDYGADLYLETTYGYNALIRAMLSTKIKSEEVRKDMIEMIVEADPKIITYENAKGYSALSTAVYCGLTDIEELLLNHKRRWVSLIRSNKSDHGD